MTLDRETCRRARLARDARFDGRFFVGVKTTRVFCRPICPVVAPKEQNVEYFPSAAAAAEAGFRACLRCRPECSPGTPAWNGTPATVSRALRLIGDAGPGDASIESLAARLGLGTRHLRRLFLAHLGATPIAIVQTRRLLSAKRLIDETELPLTAIAMSAGYGSVRRFNAAFLESYGRSPRELRDLGRRRLAPAGRRAPTRGRLTLRLGYRPPFDWDALAAFLATRAIPGVEAVAGGVYRRSILLNGIAGRIEVQPGGRRDLALRIEYPDASALLTIVGRVRRMFDLDADPLTVAAHLGREPLLAPFVRRRPGLRVPGCWDGFELAVRAILGQQITVAAATTLSGRLVMGFGRALGDDAGGVTHLFPEPCAIAAVDLHRIGIPRKRAEALTGLAAAVASGALSIDPTADPTAFREQVRRLPGIGAWTAEYIALRALGDPDAFPAGDLGLLAASGDATARQLEEQAEAWRPWRAYAAVHLWQGARDGWAR